MRTVSDQIWDDRACEFALNPKYNRFQRGLASMVYSLLDKKIGLGADINEKLAQLVQLYKPVNQNSKEREAMQDLNIKICSRFS